MSATATATRRGAQVHYVAEVDGQEVTFKSKTEFAHVILARIDTDWQLWAKTNAHPDAAHRQVFTRITRTWPDANGAVVTIKVKHA